MARGRKRKLFKFKPKKQTTLNIVAIILLGISALIIISFFQTGSKLDNVRAAVDEYFGILGIFLPVILSLIALLFLRIRLSITRINVPFGMLLAYTSFVSLSQSGIVGREIWMSFSDAISELGSFIVLFGMFCIGLIVLFNTSLEDIIKFISTTLKEMNKMFTPLFKRSKPLFIEKLPIKPPGEFKTNYKKDLSVTTDEQPTRPVVKKNPGVAASPAQQKQMLQQSAALNSSLMTYSGIPAQEKIWEYPPITLLDSLTGKKADRGDIKHNAMIIEKTLESFGINARVVEVNLGPAVTQYALEIALGTKLSKITSLSNDLALALAAPTGQIRIEAPIPGRSLVGIEIPNRSLEFVTLQHMLSSKDMKDSNNKLLVALGLDVSGNPINANIAKMPHVLIAGTTGSGKSVLINSWISSLLFRTNPSEVRLILVDPKRVELTGYNGIPHLLTPVIVEPDQILSALKWATQEMDKRYKIFAEVGVRNIDSYNELSGFQAIPYIVIFIDELADLMAYAPVEVEDSICRLAQMARATGIHLVVATQRPSVDVITGLIKANIPSRIAFNVSSMIDSRVIIDTPGAEKLLGRGDMLFIPPDQAKPARIQGTYVSEKEVSKLVDYLKNKNAPVQYTQEILSMPQTWKKSGGSMSASTAQTGDDGKDQLFEEAVRVVCQYDRASASLLQRRLSVGYARAARIIDQLETEGVIGAGEGSKPRDVLIRDPETYFENQASAGGTATVPSQNNPADIP